MTFTPAKPPQKAAYLKAIRARLNNIKGGGTVTLFFPVGEAERLFGPDAVGPGYALGIGRAGDGGTILIARPGADKGGVFEMRRSMRGSTRLVIGAWDMLPRENHKAVACRIEQAIPDGIVLRLPDWANPQLLAAEHGLKRG